MPDKSGKDRGSITQKADDQQVRISQVSNVSNAVSAMGKKTTKEMQETERRINENNDSKEIAGSMNSVLASLKNTIDSLEKGVEAATLGTAKAAKDAIQQYGTAISEDFKINRQNMVASALSTATPMFGYFASKFMETGMFKKAKDNMKEGLAKIFSRKSKGGEVPDDMGSMGGVSGKGAAASAQNAKMASATKKKDTIDTYKVIDKQRHEKYEVPENKKMLIALTAIQGALGAQIGKFDQWYGKFLLEHPYFRAATIAYKATKATFGGIWKATYFFWKPRGGYKRQLSKAKQPLEAINQNIATLFVQQMPRLDALMIYTKATAIATRDLSSHVTGKKYPMMDASKLGGTWNLASSTMKILRLIGKGVKKGAKKLSKSMFLEGSKARNIFEGAIEGGSELAHLMDLGVTGPGRIKKWGMSKLPGAKERKRLFGGLDATEGPPGDFPGSKKKPECMPVYFCEKKRKRLPKNVKGMGRRIKPDLIVQNVYDELHNKHVIKKDKFDKKLLGYTANSAKFLKKHDEREKKRTVLGMLGGIFSGVTGIISSLFGLLGGIFGGGGGIGKLITGLALNPAFWLAVGIVPALIGTKKIWDWLDTKFGDGGTLGNTLFTSLRNAFPQFDLTSSVLGGVSDGIGRLFKGEEFDMKQILKDSLNDLWDRKFGFSLKTWLKGIKGDLTDKEKDELYEKQMEKRFGKDKYAIELKQRRLKEAKGFKETSKAYLDLVAGKLKSKLGMDVDESEIAITALRAQKLVEKYGGNVNDYISLKAKDAEAYGKKILKAAKEKAKLAKDKTTEIALVTSEEAQKLAAKYGGVAKDYVNKKYPEAVVYGKKVRDKALAAANYIREKATMGATVTAEKAKELSDKYGGKPEEYYDKTLGDAIKYGQKIKDKLPEYTDTVKTQAKKVAEASAEKAGEAKGWLGKQWESIKKWADKEKAPLTKTGEFIELGKGNFLELYRQGGGRLDEFMENASPERKAWIRRNAEKLLLSGQVTVAELKKMGISLKDATVEVGEKVGGAIVTSAVNTTQNITNSVNQMGGGGGGNSKFIQEQTMDDIARGDVEY